MHSLLIKDEPEGVVTAKTDAAATRLGHFLQMWCHKFIPPCFAQSFWSLKTYINSRITTEGIAWSLNGLHIKTWQTQEIQWVKKEKYHENSAFYLKKHQL